MGNVKQLHGRLYLELLAAPIYQDMLSELRSRRPQIPAWDAKNDNSREILKAVAQREWHDLMMVILNPQEKSDG